MAMIETFTSPEHLVPFFAEHAGYSYDPATETPKQGRLRCAAELASAAMRAFEDGCSFEWSVDPDGARYYDGESATEWACVMRNSSGAVCGSLSGIGLGESDPWSDPYRRVVEAELALEHYRA